MRELVFRNLYSAKSHKRDISVQETFENDGITTETQKRSIYFVRDRYRIDSLEEMKKWSLQKKHDPSLNKKSFYILKKHTDCTGEDEIYCKARGAFYVIVGKEVFNVIFLHTLKMKMSRQGA